jgi:hypothetical protein
MARRHLRLRLEWKSRPGPRSEERLVQALRGLIELAQKASGEHAGANVGRRRASAEGRPHR